MQKLQDAVAKISKLKNQISMLSEVDLSKSRTKSKYLDKLKNQEHNLMLEYAADPELFDYIKCWRIEILGKSELTIEDANNIKRDENDQIVPPDGYSLEEYTNIILNKSNGNVGYLIRNYLAEIGVHKYLSSSSGGFWNFSIHTTSSQADFVCSKMFEKFEKSIKSNIFQIIRKPWFFEFEHTFAP